MSAAAEPSKALLEVYQPLLVGLGAVVFTLIGNTFLEWWKGHLDRKRTENNIRKAVILELMQLHSIIANLEGWLTEPGETKFISFHSPESLIEFDKTKIAVLPTIEALSAGNIITIAEGLMSSAMGVSSERRLITSKTVSLNLNDTEASAFLEWVRKTKPRFTSSYQNIVGGLPKGKVKEGLLEAQKTADLRPA